MMNSAERFLYGWKLSRASVFVLILILVFSSPSSAQSNLPHYSFVYYYPDAPVLSPFDVFDNLDELGTIIDSAHRQQIEIDKHIFKKKEDFETFRPGNTVDFLILDPLYWISMKEREQFQPLLVMSINGTSTHRVHLVVLKGSPIQSAADLSGHKIAATLPGKLEREIIANLYLQGFVDAPSYLEGLQRVDNAASALLSVLYRDAEAAFVPEYDKDLQQNYRQDKIIGIYETSAVLNGIFVVNRDTISEEFRSAIVRKFMALNTNPEGRKILSQMRIDGWAPVSREQLDRFQTLVEQSPWNNPRQFLKGLYVFPNSANSLEGLSYPDPFPAMAFDLHSPEPVY